MFVKVKFTNTVEKILKLNYVTNVESFHVIQMFH